MDSVYVATKKPPLDLSHQEMVLSKPLFLEEVRAAVKKKGSSAQIGPNYLRAIAEEIGRRYDKMFNAYRNVVPHDYMGRYCASDEEVAAVVHEMFQARYPLIYQRYYEHLLRERNFNIRVIYFTGDEVDESVFFRLGIRKIAESEADLYITARKPEPVALKLESSVAKSEPVKDSVSEVVAKLNDRIEVKIDRSEPVEKKEEAANSQELDQLASMVKTEEIAREKPRARPDRQPSKRNAEVKPQNPPDDQST